jgi:Ca2+-transporting ATPase
MTDKTVASSKGETPASAGGAANKWYAVSADDVAQKLGVDPANGLSAAQAAELLKKDGPNALPAEKPPPGWKLFLAQYRSYMQIILVGAALASILIGQIATGVAVLLITALNALGGLRQQGKAESAICSGRALLHHF